MFTDFLYLLRAYGLPVGLVEWTALMDGLRLGLEKESLMEFYHMARAILVKRETDYDRFDQAFAAYFKGLADHADLSEEMERWLSHALTLSDPDFEAARLLWENKSLEEIREIMSQRIKEQKEEHHGGSKWIGTGGITAFGHSGYAPKGIRIRGQRGGEHALKGPRSVISVISVMIMCLGSASSRLPCAGCDASPIGKRLQLRNWMWRRPLPQRRKRAVNWKLS